MPTWPGTGSGGSGQLGSRRLAPYEEYLRARFVDDHTIWLTALFDEVVELGYPLSNVSFARQVRHKKLRPHCEACSGVRGRETIEIDHPPGQEIQ